ncbi:copper chaperone PCu(A)C [Streptomyces sp. N2-109]|uniref:Copper chaperone PCu(A)C n=1 Tax=Streptomyces gossypii TaxID=2883101 RepID=A0ABT2JN78_9ACTN|nr:copper chaperone PCu(A)C [Streptomyces gossypii]MCT2589334.1 copper chaperone PCu(A)C [Streptomyces gossypii]
MNRRRTALPAASLALAGMFALGACGSDSDSDSGSDAKAAPALKAHGAYVPQPVMADMAGAFLVIENSGGKADKLTSVTSDLTDEVQLHKTVDQQMQRVKSMPVPADGSLDFARGGNHLMLVDLHRKPVKGDKVSLELHFEKSDAIKLSVPVKATNHTPEK